MMKTPFVLMFAFVMSIFGNLCWSQEYSIQEAIKENFHALLVQSEELPDHVKVADLPEEAAMISVFLEDNGVDAMLYFTHLGDLIAAIQVYAEEQNIDLASIAAHKLIFQDVNLRLTQEEIVNSAIPGPTFCYDIFIASMQSYVVQTASIAEQSLAQIAQLILTAWINAHQKFNSCIKENY